MNEGDTICFNGNRELESRIVDWIINNCDYLVWTNYGRQPFITGLSRDWEKHTRFIEIMNLLKDELISSYIDNKEFGYFETNRKFRHYRFRIGEKVKEFLLEKGVAHNTFTGLWDPCYYQQDTLILSTVSHENLATFWRNIPNI